MEMQSACTWNNICVIASTECGSAMGLSPQTKDEKCGYELADPDVRNGHGAGLDRCPFGECRKARTEEIHMKSLFHWIADLALLCCAGSAQTPLSQRPASMHLWCTSKALRLLNMAGLTNAHA